MTEDTINSILAVIDEKSFSKAADRLGVSQPAISAQIRKAEKELGITIFDRQSHPMHLTYQGEILSEYLNQKNELEKQFRERLRSTDSLESGTLRIGGASAFNFVFVPGMVTRFSELYPGIDIQVTDGSISQLRQKTLDGDLDLFISSPTDLTEGLHFEPLIQTKIYFCLPPRTKLTHELERIEVPLDRLDDPGDWPEADFDMFSRLEDPQWHDVSVKVPVIRLAPERNLGKMLDQLLERDHVTGRIPITADQAVTAYMMMMNGVGACLMSGTDILNFPLRERPHCFMLSNSICRRTMYMVWKEGAQLSPAATEFARMAESFETSTSRRRSASPKRGRSANLAKPS